MVSRSLVLAPRIRAGDSGELADLSDRLWAAVNGVGPALLFNESSLDLERPDFVDSAIAVVVATSGSSGTPKLVQLSGAALLASVSASAARIGAHRWWLTLPAGYVAGLQVILRTRFAFESGAISNPYPASIVPGADFAGLRLLPDDVDAVSLVPYQLHQLLTGGDSALIARMRRFEAILLGGQAPGGALLADAAAGGLSIVQSYGATETCGGCVYDGIPLDGVAVRFSQIGAATGGDALVELGGATLFSGYLEAGAAQQQQQQWWSSGDLGHLSEGKLVISGRADRVFISGGFNVSLSRIESVLAAVTPLGSQLYAVAVPDETWGERAALGVVGADAATVSLADFNAVLRAEIGVAAQLRELHFLSEFPRLSSGKVDRLALERLFQAGA